MTRKKPLINALFPPLLFVLPSLISLSMNMHLLHREQTDMSSEQWALTRTLSLNNKESQASSSVIRPLEHPSPACIESFQDDNRNSVQQRSTAVADGTFNPHHADAILLNKNNYYGLGLIVLCTPFLIALACIFLYIFARTKLSTSRPLAMPTVAAASNTPAHDQLLSDDRQENCA